MYLALYRETFPPSSFHPSSNPYPVAHFHSVIFPRTKELGIFKHMLFVCFRYYLLSAQMFAGIGRVYNQLALLAVQRVSSLQPSNLYSLQLTNFKFSLESIQSLPFIFQSRRLEAVYYYCRALSCKYHFATAMQSLQISFDENYRRVCWICFFKNITMKRG